MDSQSGRQPAPLLHLSHPDHHIPGFEVPAEASPPPTKKFILILGVLAILGALLGFGFEHISHNAPTPEVSPIWVLPFCLLLVCIATMPFIARHFWEKNYQWVSLGLGALVSTYYVFGLNAGPRLAASLADYISFITLLGSLFIVSGGILIRIRRKASPAVNVALPVSVAFIAQAGETRRPMMRSPSSV